MRYLLFILLLSITLMVSSCSRHYVMPGDGEALFMPVMPAEAMRLINEHPGLMVLDVRTGWERDSGFIAGSVHISYFDFLFGSGYGRLDKGTPVLVVCAHGPRSYRVGRSLLGRGWREVYDLMGGMKAWTGEGYPVETKDSGGPP